MRHFSKLLPALLLFVLAIEGVAQSAQQIGVAKIDVSPEGPIRLSGYGGRTKESDGVAQRLWAKALVIGADEDGPAILITVDNLGVSLELREEIANRLAKRKITSDKIAICSSHTHTAPVLTGVAPNIFSADIIPAEQERIDKYTRTLTDKIEQVALAALNDRKPSYLSWSEGSVGFAKNRRTQGGPVDHALPVLKATDTNGKIRALIANYACHCTTLYGEFNQSHGDWAGAAQLAIERDHPDCIAMITIGCGGDANPSPRAKLEHTIQHGDAVANEIKKLLAFTWKPLPAKIATAQKRIELTFDKHFTKEQLEERAKKSGIVGYHARKNLARLSRGESLPKTLPYILQTWSFGHDLAMVFLPGEVVVDYALRLKKEFDGSRLWVSAYANHVPCYIPSRRILQEGGYEAEDSLWYYDRPARLSPQNEDLIIETVHALLPKQFATDGKQAGLPPSKSPAESLSAIRTRADLRVELVASEPLVASPIAIEWGTDGKLWVCEMYDYPTGIDNEFKPGGRIKVLHASKEGGNYDRSTLFLDGLAFPTGVMPWRRGALICAAPDILYAEDTDGDGKADLVQTNFTGFATHNYQARVNGLTWSTDGWVYGSSGLFGGKIKSIKTGKTIEISGRDFRIKPDSGEIEPVAGLSQHGRIQDDWGHWFGNDNSTLLWQYPLAEDAMRRNPHVKYPEPRVPVAVFPEANKLYPISTTLERFNDPQMANRTTSACGPGIYRGDLLGSDYFGNAFICEPVHNLVRRLVLRREGVVFRGMPADDEQQAEFLASTDNWFRPVQVRTGPDGALWVVDMYRFVIEHPRWISAERLAKLDVRAGADLGRIYRILPRGRSPRAIPNLAKQSLSELKELLRATNGVLRNLAHRELFHRTGEIGVEQSSFPEPISEAAKAFDLALKSTAPETLAKIARAHGQDPWVRAAVLTSSTRHPTEILRAIWLETSSPVFTTLCSELLNTAVGIGQQAEIEQFLKAAMERSDKPVTGLLVEYLDAIEKKNSSVRDAAFKAALDDLGASVREQMKMRAGVSPESLRLLARDEATLDADIKSLADYFTTATGSGVTAALAPLGRSASSLVSSNLLQHWSRFSPGTRTALLNLLISRETWSRDLLAAVEQGNVALPEVPLAAKQKLLKDKSTEVREMATRVFADSSSGDRAGVLHSYREVPNIKGAPGNGPAIFDQNCASCHAYRGRGHQVGPNLAEFAGKSVDDFLLALLHPNAAVDARFAAYTIETKDDRSLTGIVRGETASGLTLVQPNGIEETLLRDAIKTMKASQISLMPEGLEQAISPQAMADLIAWIKDGKPARFGSASTAQAAQAKADFLRGGCNGLSRVLTAADDLPYPSWMGKLPLAYCRQTDGASRLIWETEAAPKTADGKVTFRLPAAMGFVSQPAGSFRLNFNDRAFLNCNVTLDDQAWQSEDGKLRISYHVLENNDEDSNGILELEAAASLLTPGKPAKIEVTGSAAGSQRWFGIYKVNDLRVSQSP